MCFRGSPCILPEETLAGYEAAADEGVDFLEMDAVRARAFNPDSAQCSGTERLATALCRTAFKWAARLAGWLTDDPTLYACAE